MNSGVSPKQAVEFAEKELAARRYMELSKAGLQGE
jgi:hypothetical protein